MASISAIGKTMNKRQAEKQKAKTLKGTINKTFYGVAMFNTSNLICVNKL